MKKEIFFDKNANQELIKLSIQVQKKFQALIKILKEAGKLEFPEGRKIDKNLYEIRIKFKGEFRGFYAYIKNNFIILLPFFRKKSQKTAIKNLKTAKRRLKYYE